MAQKPISTIIFEALMLVNGIFWFLILGNPVTMLFINFFAPKFAAEFAHDKDFFDEKLSKMYTQWGLKWPFLWSRYWLAYDLTVLKTKTVDQQLEFYFKVQTKPETFQAMSKDAQTRWMAEHPALINFITSEMRLNDEQFAAWLEALKNQQENPSIKEMRMRDFRNYFAKGAIPKQQVDMLIEAASQKNAVQDLLLTYVETYGLTDVQLDKIAGDDKFLNTVLQKKKIHDQRSFTLAQYGIKQTEKWMEFCKQTKDICTEAQMVMGFDQYRAFHNAGHHLVPEVILSFLQKRDAYKCRPQTLPYLVFQYEPNHGLITPEIQKLVQESQTLSGVLQQVIAQES